MVLHQQHADPALDLRDGDRLWSVNGVEIYTSKQFEELRAQEEQSLDVEVVSAFELTDTQTDRLREVLRTRFDKDITIASRVDTSLLGGVVIRAGDTVIDGSARGRLNKLAETLTR